MAEDDSAFLSRWARRKNAAAKGAPEPEIDEIRAAEAQAAEDQRLRAEAEATAEEERRAANRAAAEAVDLETADETTDFRVFMKEGVPTALRQAGLRKLWRVNPAFSVLDGLNDYDHDYNVIHTVLEKFESAWKVGKNYAQQAKEKADALARELPPEQADVETGEAPEGESATDGADADIVLEETEGEALSVSETATDAGQSLGMDLSGPAIEERTPGADHVSVIRPAGNDRFPADEAMGEDDEPKRVPLRRRFALEDWQET